MFLLGGPMGPPVVGTSSDLRGVYSSIILLKSSSNTQVVPQTEG